MLPNAWDVSSGLPRGLHGYRHNQFRGLVQRRAPTGTAPLAAPTSHWRPPYRCTLRQRHYRGRTYDEPDAIKGLAVAQLFDSRINIEDSSAEKLIDPALAMLNRCAAARKRTKTRCA